MPASPCAEAITWTEFPIDNNLTTHPLSPDMLSHFPPCEHTTPPVRPQFQPLQAVNKLADNGQTLSPPTSANRRDVYAKKCRTPLLTLSQMSTYKETDGGRNPALKIQSKKLLQFSSFVSCRSSVKDNRCVGRKPFLNVSSPAPSTVLSSITRGCRHSNRHCSFSLRIV